MPTNTVTAATPRSSGFFREVAKTLLAATRFARVRVMGSMAVRSSTALE